MDVVEAHGTGTSLGDPIEAQALLATYGRERPEGQPLWLGSVKSNFGHTQAAAGVAGVMKMVQAMRHGAVPRTLHADEPSPEVDWDSGAVALATEHRAWPETGRPRRSAVSSFGISGTNAHVVLEQAPEPAAPAEGPTPRSAPTRPYPSRGCCPAGPRGAGRPDAAAARLARRPAGPHPVDVGYSWPPPGPPGTTGPSPSAATPRSCSPASPPTPAPPRGRQAGVPLHRPGRPTPGNGTELYGAFPAFATAFDAVAALLDPELERPLADLVESEPELLTRTDHAQAAIFAVEVALFRLLETWGVRPDLLVGHSVGELAAAHVSGVLSSKTPSRWSSPADG
ncbi:acyltransferase domain-containing protein [Streptomyces sp. M19]